MAAEPGQQPDTSVVVVGCGPVGATAANLLGNSGLSVVVLERDLAPVDVPRAIHFDASIMRVFQAAGLAGRIEPQCRVIEAMSTYGAQRQLLSTSSSGTGADGWAAHYNFFQPTLEATLREGLDRFDHVRLEVGAEVVGLVQHERGVSVTWRAADGTERVVRAGHVIAADGASSFVRRLLGVGLDDLDFDEPWLVIDALVEGDHGLPAATSQMFCDPRRPTTLVPGPGAHRRWEFMLLPGESPEQMLEQAPALLADYVEPSSTQVLRASVYRFHALLARQWRVGDVLLAGDAAHQTPPFLGQGMCHGIRDVQAITWRLRAIADGADPALLDSYQDEREPQVRTVIERAVLKGREICILDPELAAERDRAVAERSRWSGALDSTFALSVDSGLVHPDRPAGVAPLPQAMPDGRLLDDRLPAGFIAIRRAREGEAEQVVAAVPPLVATAVVDSPAVGEWLEAQRARWAVLRPDRHAFGFAADDDELGTLLAALAARFGGLSVD